jgi:hypothetical protein
MAAILVGCYSPKPERVLPVSNNDYQIDQLFTDHNGCTIYRFYDQGDYRYYLVGPAGAHMLPSTTRVTETPTQTQTIVVPVETMHKD